jgi:hypothetical protein
MQMSSSTATPPWAWTLPKRLSNVIARMIPGYNKVDLREGWFMLDAGFSRVRMAMKYVGER